MPNATLDLDAIQARANAATPGPWGALHRDMGCSFRDDERAGLGLDIVGPLEATNRGQFARGADAWFIARARTDIPALIAAVRERDAEIAELRKRPTLGEMLTLLGEARADGGGDVQR